MKLDAKMPVIECCIGHPVPRIAKRQRHIVGQKIGPANRPALSLASKGEKPLAG